MDPFVRQWRKVMGGLFAAFFFLLSIALAGITVTELASGLFSEQNLTESLIKSINMAVVALAVFELALVVTEEYASGESQAHISTVLRRTVPRFVSIVCVGLVLEGLLMVIKYSQLDLAGNLYYPVAVIASAALLLTALGLFLRFSVSLTPPQPALDEEQRSGQEKEIEYDRYQDGHGGHASHVGIHIKTRQQQQAEAHR